MYGRRPYGVGMLVAGFDVSSTLVAECMDMFVYLLLCSLKALICIRPHLHQTMMIAKPWLSEHGHSQHVLTLKRTWIYFPMVI